MSKKRFSRIAENSVKATESATTEAPEAIDVSTYRPDPLAVAAVYQNRASLKDAISGARSLIGEMGELRAIRQVIAEEGISAGVAKMLRAAGYETVIGDRMPAVENLAALPLDSSHRLVLPVLEALDAAMANEGTMSRSDAEEVVNALMAVISTVADDIEYREDVLEASIELLQSADVNESVFSNLTGSLPDAETADKVMDVLVSATSGMSTPIDFADGSAEAVKSANDDAVKAANEIGDVVGLSVSDSGEVEQTSPSEEYAAKDGKLSDLGYDKEAFLAILGKAATLVDSLENVRDNEAAIREAFDNALAKLDGDGEEAPAEPEEPAAEPDADAGANEDGEGGEPATEDADGDDSEDGGEEESEADKDEGDADGDAGENEDDASDDKDGESAEAPSAVELTSAVCNIAVTASAILAHAYDAVVGLTEASIQVENLYKETIGEDDAEGEDEGTDEDGGSKEEEKPADAEDGNVEEAED
jgi:hypothetical protein